ncbi:MAG: TlpA disulfide reductase family protein [Bacteroidales bacterium]|nr:TlpA disulfide reductase family protein [Bacteroidales bacterium]
MKNIWIIVLGLIISSCIKEEQGVELVVGDRLPDFEVVMNDGSVVDDDILSEGVSVVMFFHTSCPDCQQALPRMQQIYDEYISKGVYFAFISREESAVDIESYFNEKGLKLPYSAQNDRKVYEQFAQTRIPRIYICEKGGIIRYIFTDDPVPTYDLLKSSLDSVIR